MAKFLNRFELTYELHQIIDEATEYLCLISPYFKLTESIKNAFSRHAENKKFELIIVYGKNEEAKNKSLSDADMDFFKSFPNVEIRYHKRLHAKIYLNETKCLLTSMNLHDYSMKENIEFGILTQRKFLDNFMDSLDKQAANFADYITEKSTIEHSHYLKKEKKIFGLFTTYGETITEVDKKRYGYCLRFGVQIPYDITRPYSLPAFQSWGKYQNWDYLEKYCHECGSLFKTSMRQPLCPNCHNER